jgi:hypothetical protein
MNDADTVEIDDDIRQTAWFVTEASGFMGVQARQDRLISRVAERMRRRSRPEHLISNSIFGLFRHALAYAPKLLFGISLAPTPCAEGVSRGELGIEPLYSAFQAISFWNQP